MDRFGVRPVSLSLLAGTIVGALASGLATGPEGFLFGQFLLGVATSGMLMCPMTLARSRCRRRGSACGPASSCPIGNIGMLLSSSPLAFVVELWGWRAGFWISARLWRCRRGCGVRLVPKQPAAHADNSSPLSQMAEVLRIGLSRPLRGLIAMALVSLAALAGAARIVGRPVADGDQGARPHRGRQCARPVHARVDRRTGC